MRRVSGRWVHYAGVSERCERVDRSVFAEGKTSRLLTLIACHSYRQLKPVVKVVV